MKASLLLIMLLVNALMVGCSTVPVETDNLSLKRDGEIRQSGIKESVLNKSFTKLMLSNIKEDVAQASTHIRSADELSAKHLLSPGDTLKLTIVSLAEYSGFYIVDAQGEIDLPFSKPVYVQGLSTNELAVLLKDILVQEEWFYPGRVMLDLNIVEHAQVMVYVSGAVFNPGRLDINGKPAIKPDSPIVQLTGAYSAERDLVAALYAAGGVRPDAALNEIYIKRDNQLYKIDLTSLLSGENIVKTPALMANDQIFVASTGYEQDELITPSQITPPGVRIFLSNVTSPAPSILHSKDGDRLPYGSSLIDAAVSAGCVGGVRSTNAGRSIVLITRNYSDKKQTVISRSVSQLLNNSSDKTVNPHLMPNDAVACYDSRFTNFRDVVKGISEVLSPLVIGSLL